MIFHNQHQFMTATQQEPNATLYIDLVKEEVIEEMLPAWEKYKKAPTRENQTELADGIIDSIYVLAGLANSLFGPDMSQKLWDEVQNSNMSKCEFKDGKYYVTKREDGKILKGPGYFKPNLFDILNNLPTPQGVKV